MQTKTPFSCRDRSPSDANVTGLNNRRDARGVRNNRRVEARSGAWCRRSTNIDITEPSILNNSQEGSNVVLLQPQTRPANQESPAHPNYSRWALSATSSPNGRKKIYIHEIPQRRPCGAQLDVGYCNHWFPSVKTESQSLLH